MRVGPLDRAELAAARQLLATACAFDRADVVAEEKLFGPGPAGVARAFGAWDGDALVGVAAISARYLRVLAVAPAARGRGAGSALLEACERGARDAGEPRLRALDQPGNYLAPGIDERNVDTIAWLEKRGWRRDGDPRSNVLIAVRDNPRVTVERAEELAAAARARGYELRRARQPEYELLQAVQTEFGNAWPFEVALATGLRLHEPFTARTVATSQSFKGPSGVHVALLDGSYCAFAAHDGNNRGLGWFGPTGTWPAHRGKGLGEALLLACLVDVAADHERCEVAWIGPRPFYEKAAGIVEDRRFVAMGTVAMGTVTKDETYRLATPRNHEGREGR
ncbi:MAG: GNAT family N-acetyltransferase [Kofleriaceae bacterium]